jgi:hypothetical protein
MNAAVRVFFNFPSFQPKPIQPKSKAAKEEPSLNDRVGLSLPDRSPFPKLAASDLEPVARHVAIKPGARSTQEKRIMHETFRFVMTARNDETMPSVQEHPVCSGIDTSNSRLVPSRKLSVNTSIAAKLKP